MCQKSGRQTKPANFGTFWSIFRDPVHIFQNRFLRWNHELKPVVLSTMSPINRKKISLSYKGVCGIFPGIFANLNIGKCCFWPWIHNTYIYLYIIYKYMEFPLKYNRIHAFEYLTLQENLLISKNLTHMRL